GARRRQGQDRGPQGRRRVRHHPHQRAPGRAAGGVTTVEHNLDEFLDVENELNQRWPETKLEPSLDRIKALAHVLSDPQTNYPVVQLTGTNGKTSTSRMVDALFTRIGLRTGRFTSPHLQLATERISLD